MKAVCLLANSSPISSLFSTKFVAKPPDSHYRGLGFKGVAISVAALLIASQLGAGNGQAVALTWQGTTGSWNSLLNWGGSVPNATTDVDINNGGTVQVTSASSEGRDIFLGRLSVSPGAAGHLEVLAAPAALDAQNIFVGYDRIGTLNITGGLVTNFATQIGSQASSNGEATVAGSDSLWISSGGMNIGDAGRGTLNILDGGSVSTVAVSIGRVDGSSGTANIDGEDSILASSGNLVVGTRDEGELRVTRGGQVSNVNGFVGSLFSAVGEATVDGTGSTWTNAGDLSVGYQGAGTLEISGGGAVSNVNGVIGSEAGSSGSVSVTGVGSTWTISDSLRVGKLGVGSLSIADGAAVSSNVAYIGELVGTAASTVNVSGANSKWIGNVIAMDPSGSATLNVTSGGGVLSYTGIVGRLGGSGTATATIDGPGSTWANNNELVVGHYVAGKLNVTRGGAASSAGNASIGRMAGSTGTVSVVDTGSTFSVNQRLSIGGDAVTGTDGGSGTLDIGLGGRVIVGRDVTIFPGDTLKLSGGTLDAQTVNQGSGLFSWTSGTLHVGMFNGNLSNPGGKLAPGHSAGSTTVVGNYTQGSAGELEIEIGGLGAGSTYDLVGVTGNAVLGGELQLDLIDGFIPAGSDTFTVLNSAALFGVFSNVANGGRLPTVDGIGSFLVHYGAGSVFNQNQVILRAFELATLPGDYNRNGVVDAADYVVWRKTLGQTGAGLAADGDGNNLVDSGDYAVWRARFGASLGVGSGSAGYPLGASAEPLSAAVPEPATLVLLTLAVVGWCLPQRSRQR
jgi:T5SS/PEP-CTERM-associated repeat protein